MGISQGGGTMYRRVLPWLAVVLLAVVCLAGWAPLHPVGPRFSRLQVLRTSENPHVPPFAARVTDGAKIERLYAAIEALPAYPTGPIFCPLYLGVYYHLTFVATASLVFQVDLEVGACSGVYFHGTRQPPDKSSSPQFWQLFAQTVDFASTLQLNWPPPSTGPSAPTPSS
jgi:hypothetical protein